MHGHVLSRLIQAACGGLLAFGVLGTLPAAAQSIPASFDCAKAERPVDRFICAHAVLRWQDLALSRAYAAARKAAVSGPARDELVRSQRDWVRERDRRCIADRSFKELSGSSNPLGTQAYDCLDTVYLDRRGTLLDRGAAPLTPTRIVALDLTPIEAARPGNRTDTGLRIPDILVSPDGALLAILLPSQEIDFPDQVWLYRVADGKLIEATPRPDTRQPHPDGAPMAIQALAWQKSTLYVRIALWGASGDGDPEKSPTVVLAATLDGSHPLGTVPRDIQALLDAPPPDTVSPDEIPESSQDILGTPQGNRDFLAWAEDLGHGTIELRMRKRSPESPVYRVAWGSWDLGAYLFDARRAQLIYSADTGIVAFDMATHGERRIAGTSRGDHLYALSADQRLLVWSTRNACGDELQTQQDEDAPEHICLAHLTAPKARP
ncbi:lysozyme inhibitor LprI family protein [Castellaniella sp. WN]